MRLLCFCFLGTTYRCCGCFKFNIVYIQTLFIASSTVSHYHAMIVSSNVSFLVLLKITNLYFNIDNDY
jgi:hypothetical protein